MFALLLTIILLSSCSSSNTKELNDLNVQIAELTKQNEDLKSQITKLNSELANIKTEVKESSNTPNPTIQPTPKPITQSTPTPTQDTIKYSTSGVTDDEKGFAWAVAQKQVKDNLKAPSTAKFAKYADMPVSKSGSNFKVEGYVDAENSFGAKIRSNFSVEFEKTGKNTYNLKNVSIK